MKIWKWAAMLLGGLVAIGVVLYVVGLFIPVAHVASSSVRLRQPVDSIWRTVRALEESASWWPAVSAMERLPDKDGREVWLQRQTTGDVAMEVMESREPVRGSPMTDFLLEGLGPMKLKRKRAVAESPSRRMGRSTVRFSA